MILTTGSSYATRDGRVYCVTHAVFGGFLAAHRADKADGSARLFYPNGQYVGSDAERDMKDAPAFTPARRAS